MSNGSSQMARWTKSKSNGSLRVADLASILDNIKMFAAYTFEVDVKPGIMIPQDGVITLGGHAFTYNRLDWQGTPVGDDIEIQHGQKLIVLVL